MTPSSSVPCTSSGGANTNSSKLPSKRQLKGYLQDKRSFEDNFIAAFLIGCIGVFILVAADETSLFITKIVGIGLFIFSIAVLWLLFQVSRPPVNNPWKFIISKQRQKRVAPTLVCLGDSITHGRVSYNWVETIRPKIASKIAHRQVSTKGNNIFQEPLYVINFGQNFITSYSIAKERIQPTIECEPDYVVVMVGTNDIIMGLSAYVKARNRYFWNLPPTVSTMEVYEENLKEIISGLLLQGTNNNKKPKIALCTLPPIGEDLTSIPNQSVKAANVIVQKVAKLYEKDCTVLDVFEAFQQVIRSKQSTNPSSFIVGAVLAPFLYYFLGLGWLTIGKLYGHEVMADRIHINDKGGKIISNLVVSWLLDENIKKVVIDKLKG